MVIHRQMRRAPRFQPRGVGTVALVKEGPGQKTCVGHDFICS
jgi:hypothetical protein